MVTPSRKRQLSNRQRAFRTQKLEVTDPAHFWGKLNLVHGISLVQRDLYVLAFEAFARDRADRLLPYSSFCRCVQVDHFSLACLGSGAPNHRPCNWGVNRKWSHLSLDCHVHLHMFWRHLWRILVLQRCGLKVQLRGKALRLVCLVMC